MPNWITNKVQAPSHVIKAMLNTEGRVDLNKVQSFPGPNNSWDGIYSDAETAAEAVLGIPISGHSMIALFQKDNRGRINIQSMPERSFQQFVGMLENYRACGYLHAMEFARSEWGTKWNACESKADPDNGICQFDTAWNCPDRFFLKLSKQFHDDEITVAYADEDIGCNCGTITLKAGEIVTADVAPAYKDQSEADRSKWAAFAYQVKGWEPEPEDDDEAA